MLRNRICRSSNEKITKLIEQHNGTVILEKIWGKKALAYEVKKQTKGTYMLFDYTGDNHVVADIERSLRLDDMILKFLTVRLADEVDVEARKKTTG
jgi:small subunit ribosomal protein S6